MEEDIEEVIRYYDQFIEILKQMSMSAGEQIAKLKGTVVADEIALDFSEIGMMYAKELLENGWLTQEQYIIAKSIDGMLNIMSERNGLWTEDALLNAEEWDQCRKKARSLLEMLE